jgi:hypothetical protein
MAREEFLDQYTRARGASIISYLRATENPRGAGLRFGDGCYNCNTFNVVKSSSSGY